MSSFQHIWKKSRCYALLASLCAPLSNALASPGDIKWTFDIGAPIHGSAAMDATGVLYIGSDDNNLYALNKDGSLKWTFKSEGDIRSTPAIAPDGTIYFTSMDSLLYALNPDGSQKWSYEMNIASSLSPAIAIDGTIYICAQNQLTAINPNGTPEWQFDVDCYSWYDPSIDKNGVIYIASAFRDLMYAVLPTGQLKWAFPVNDQIATTATIGVDQSVYFSDKNGVLYIADENGNQRLQHGYGSRSELLIDTSGTLYGSADEGYLYALNADTSMKWSFWVNGELTAPALGNDNTLYIGSSNHDFVAVSSEGLRLWQYSADAAFVADPLIADGTVYSATADGIIYAFSSSSSDIKNTPWPMAGQNNTRTASLQALDTDLDGTPDYQDNDDDQDGIVDNDDAFPANALESQDNDQDGIGNIADDDDDNDGFSDQFEIEHQFDPFDANQHPTTGAGTLANAFDIYGAYQMATHASKLHYLHTNTTLFAIDSNGTQQWQYEFSEKLLSGIAVDNEGTAYVGTDKSLFAIDQSGQLKWTFNTNNGFRAVPSIGADGTVYASNLGSDGHFYALNALDGSIKWSLPLDGVQGSAAISKNGTIYVGAQSSLVYAITPDGEIIWQYDTAADIEPAISYLKTIRHGPSLSHDGTIYIGNNRGDIIALTPEGQPKWQQNVGNKLSNSILIGADNTVYVPTQENGIYAFDAAGNFKWRFGDATITNLMLGDDNLLYAYAYRDTGSVLYALTAHGVLQWQYKATGLLGFAADKSLYINNNSQLYTINVTAHGPANTPWPMVNQNPQNNGRINNNKAVPHDFDGDGRSDLLWRHAVSGDNFWYQMNGLSVQAKKYINNVATDSWLIAGIADFNGDLMADILWRNTLTGQNYIYFMQGNLKIAQGFINAVPLPWQIAGLGDFDGNGKADVLWRNPDTGENWIYLMDGATALSKHKLSTISDPQWQVAGIADLNADSKDDIVWRHTGTGVNYVYLMDGTKRLQDAILNTVPIDWKVAGLGDFNNDGYADILWHNQNNGAVWIYQMHGLQIVAKHYLSSIADTQWQAAQIGDFNGDGQSDILWRHSSSGDNVIHLIQNNTRLEQKDINRIADLNWQLP